jgi:hypothetical protein
LIRQPKYGHLKELHKAIKLCEKALLAADSTVTSLGSYEQVCNVNSTEDVREINSPAHAYCCAVYICKPLLMQYNIFQAHVFSSDSGGCAAFLSNYNTKQTARVKFNNIQYSLPPWSISILPDCKNVVFNTAQVSERKQ